MFGRVAHLISHVSNKNMVPRLPRKQDLASPYSDSAADCLQWRWMSEWGEACLSVITHYQQRSVLKAAEAATWPALPVRMNMEGSWRGWLRTGRWWYVQKPHWESYMLHTHESEIIRHVRVCAQKVSERARDPKTIQWHPLIFNSLTRNLTVLNYTHMIVAGSLGQGR